MSENYVIHQGSKMRLHPEVDSDPSLVALVDAVFSKSDCLRAYSIFTMQQGWIFRKKSRFLCLVYQGADAYRLANAEIGRLLEAYFQTHPGFLDLMSLDYGNPEQRKFTSELMAKLPFKKKADPVDTDNDRAVPGRV